MPVRVAGFAQGCCKRVKTYGQSELYRLGQQQILRNFLASCFYFFGVFPQRC
jgi:hypothetical protein